MAFCNAQEGDVVLEKRWGDLCPPNSQALTDVFIPEICKKMPQHEQSGEDEIRLREELKLQWPHLSL